MNTQLHLVAGNMSSIRARIFIVPVYLRLDINPRHAHVVLQNEFIP